MDKEKIYKDLLCSLEEKQILRDEPMKNHTTFRIGGNADFMVKAESKNDIIFTYNYAKKNSIPFYIIGKASNLLVKDNGIRGIVVKNFYDNIKIVEENEEFVIFDVASGTSLAKLANFALDNSLEGMEFCFGIPGTIGGSVRMNAGAYGGEVKDFVVQSTVLDKNGEEKILGLDEHGFVYRNSSVADNGYIVLNTRIKLKRGNKDEIKNKMDENMKARLEKQPCDMPSAGSVFKRGNGFITAIAIDSAGLKGKKIGGAMVSEKHAGFIVNAGNATAKDVIELIEYIKKTVKEKFGYNLVQEVIVVGE